MASTKPQLLLPSQYGATQAPPPTPSNHHLASSSSSSDPLSEFLNRSLPLFSLSLSKPPPLPISHPQLLSIPLHQVAELLDPSTTPFFQLTHHNIDITLAQQAEIEGKALFHSKEVAPKGEDEYEEEEGGFCWPLGFDDHDHRSFCFDSSIACRMEVHEYFQAMESVGLQIAASLAKALGSECSSRSLSSSSSTPGPCCGLMWVSEQKGVERPVSVGRVYPYVVGLQHQLHPQPYFLDLGSKGWVKVQQEVGSILVTIGDIAKVWSDGRWENVVRGRAVVAKAAAEAEEEIANVTTMLVSPSLESTVQPLFKKEKEETEGRSFSDFLMRDYAWRVYHQRFPAKDPLQRYRLSLS
ncbi:uncharacterized protein LOC18433439 isoform X1 [Amborella trichopoda]|uniref:uncharacterized protein LOC18433439 isoform X1 n=1 Tax=Amborella trichopoda TaxID=13333 RepID=UPI0009BE6FF4|nr:uncharacterized protein LOC18433439 isoform X1 [Amborella trichopoda]|eukprot:XP_020522301.1 uncharacterized protein LOC18433439 isoform X1 [Amborella trichopoda]